MMIFLSCSGSSGNEKARDRGRSLLGQRIADEAQAAAEMSIHMKNGQCQIRSRRV